MKPYFVICEECQTEYVSLNPLSNRCPDCKWRADLEAMEPYKADIMRGLTKHD